MIMNKSTMDGVNEQAMLLPVWHQQQRSLTRWAEKGEIKQSTETALIRTIHHVFKKKQWKKLGCFKKKLFWRHLRQLMQTNFFLKVKSCKLLFKIDGKIKLYLNLIKRFHQIDWNISASVVCHLSATFLRIPSSDRHPMWQDEERHTDWHSSKWRIRSANTI